MPNIFLLTSPERTNEVISMLPELGKSLREATAKALGDTEPYQVAVRVFPFIAGDNATDMQIFCVASHSDEREPKLTAWSVELADAWVRFAESRGITWNGNVDVWPIMPRGRWMMAQDETVTWVRATELLEK